MPFLTQSFKAITQPDIFDDEDKSFTAKKVKLFLIQWFTVMKEQSTAELPFKIHFGHKGFFF